MKRSLWLGIGSLLLIVAVARAHYPWLTVDGKGREKGTINLYFEEGPRAGDGRYLDPFLERGTTWIRTAKEPKPVKISLKDTKEKNRRWLSTGATVDRPRSVEHYVPWGVYRYGKIDVLLHYQAKHIEANKSEDLEKLARAEHIHLDIVPKQTAGGIEITLLWKGKPVAKRPLDIRGPGGRKVKRTDAQGKAIIPITARVRYFVKTFIELDEGGTFNGKKYQKVRHHCTLGIRPPIK